MSTKTEEKINKLFDSKLEEHISVLNERIGGVFLYGFIVGVVVSYSGFLSYFAGIGTGVLIAKKYEYISYQITEKATCLLNTVLKTYKQV